MPKSFILLLTFKVESLLNHIISFWLLVEFLIWIKIDAALLSWKILITLSLMLSWYCNQLCIFLALFLLSLSLLPFRFIFNYCPLFAGWRICKQRYRIWRWPITKPWAAGTAGSAGEHRGNTGRENNGLRQHVCPWLMEVLSTNLTKSSIPSLRLCYLVGYDKTVSLRNLITY